jgi:TrmH family RNA methyltransferase
MQNIRQTITSTSNQRIKDVLQLAKGRKRKAAGVFGVEGVREISRALASGFVPDTMFVCEEMLTTEFARELDAAAGRHQCPVFAVSRAVFEKLAMREDSGGAFVVFQDRVTALTSLQMPDRPLIIAVQGIEKPGNLGALLRSADGAGVDAVVVLDSPLDLFNPNVIRSSLGTVFSNALCHATSDEFLDFCRARQIKTFAAALTDRTTSYESHDYTGASAILLGSEADGLTPFWLAAADHVVKIPMMGIADSLNVAMAGAIFVYEARRQRTCG